MYDKDLNNYIGLRLSDKDIIFLKAMAEYRNVSLSKLIRYILSEYRREYEIGVLNNDK